MKLDQNLSSHELCCLVYMSTALPELGDGDLEAILERSQHNNSAASITGLLLYSGDHFIQVLEGPAEAVTGIYSDRILVDSRHSKIVLLTHEGIERRSFDHWTMALKAISPSTLSELPGFASYETAGGSLPVNSPIGVRIRKLLETFRLAA